MLNHFDEEVFFDGCARRGSRMMAENNDAGTCAPDKTYYQ